MTRYSRNDFIYIYTQKVLKVLLLSAPKYCRGKMRVHYFSGQLFSCMMYKQKWSLRLVVKIMCPRATPLGTYFLEGNLVYIISPNTASEAGGQRAYCTTGTEGYDNQNRGSLVRR